MGTSGKSLGIAIRTARSPIRSLSCSREAPRTSRRSHGRFEISQRSRFHSRQVEKISHDPVETVRFLRSVLEKLLPRRVVEPRVVLLKSGQGARDRDEGSSQIVRDRAQERRLELFGLPHELHVAGLLGEIRALDRDGRLADERVQQALFVRGETLRALAKADAENADHALRGS